MSTIATVIAALALLLVAGATLFVTLLLSRASRRLRENRVTLVFAGFKAARTLGPKGGLPPLGRAAEQLRVILSLGLARSWGTRATTKMLLLVAALAALVSWAFSAIALHFSAWIAGPAAVSAFVLLPRFLLKREQARADAQFMNLFPDAIDMGVRMIRAGLPITAAIRAIANEAAPPVNDVFKTLADQIEIGVPFEEALALTGERIGLADFKFFAVAVALQSATGGNLATTLEVISEIMRKRRTVRLKAQATTAEVRVSAYILGAMPFLVTGVLLLIQPGYLAPLITDPRGKMVLGAASISLILGFMMMRHMMRAAIRL